MSNIEYVRELCYEGVPDWVVEQLAGDLDRKDAESNNLLARIKVLETEAKVAKTMYDIAVKERDYERVRAIVAEDSLAECRVLLQAEG